MKSYIKLAAVALMTVTASGMSAQDTMYLIKGDHVVGKYAVDAVDYVSFELPDDVKDGNIWIGDIKAGKNTVTYTVNAIDDTKAYAHNVLSYYDINYNALSYYGDMLENLDVEDQIYCMKETLSYDAYVAYGTKTMTQTDFDSDNANNPYSRFSVIPGTHYFLCVWEIDPSTGDPLETFAYAEFDTNAPGESSASSNVTFKRQNSEGLAFDITADRNVKYFRTAYGPRNTMELYSNAYGLDFTIGTFGQNWTPDELTGMRPDIDDVENATWPAYDSGEYVLYVRAYDYNGDVKEHTVYATFDAGEEETGPAISVFSRSKDNGKVSVNFEITPSNIEEGYVRMIAENTVDDRLNMGYELHEIAMGGDATDITNSINTTGEYTFTADIPDDSWYCILITALDKDGHRTTQRMSFNAEPTSEWADYTPVYKAGALKVKKPVTSIRFKNNPTIKRLLKK